MVGNIPNLLTLTRIVILPFFVVTLVYRQYQYALILFVIASVTDLLDGLIARMTGQITELGKILDPVADKFFLITSFVLMSMTEMIPTWLAIVVISKDVIIVAGFLILYMITHTLKIEPSMLGKVSSALQFILIGLVILFRNIRDGIQIGTPLFVIVAVVTALSGMQYLYRGMKMAAVESPGAH
ncbi:MAG: CDP-diacylglycerol--glycerol-3-phosphate 3-phosphatidyltransferase [Nitrospiraceae bacterium]|nr:MAG: CDP-diacylglycerol--glycerol-3-phosphate 3-phosphatidyltransferase [Nitrospiraceae bacterium]